MGEPWWGRGEALMDRDREREYDLDLDGEREYDLEKDLDRLRLLL